MDAFLDETEIREARLGASTEVDGLLAGHYGEVWITGLLRLEAASAR